MGNIEDAAKEAVAIAKGEIAAARIYLHGHFYVPETALRQARLDALEEAAVACEKEQLTFLSHQYAADQPMSSMAERFACRQCADIIRELKDKT